MDIDKKIMQKKIIRIGENVLKLEETSKLLYRLSASK